MGLELTAKTKRKSKASTIIKPEKAGWSRKRKFDVVALAVVFVVLAIWGVLLWFDHRREAHFEGLALAGQAALSAVESPPYEGTGHQRLYPYRDNQPTSGLHHPDPLGVGFYDKQQMPARLVHSLEHGHVVAYYDEPGFDAFAILKEWSSLLDGHWDGVIVGAKRGLNENVLLTAWQNKLALESFDETAAAAFVDRYRGRGPENPVC